MHCTKFLSRFAIVPFALLLTATSAADAMAQQITGLFYKKSETTEGYNLFAPFRGSGVYLIDNDGMLIHKWIDNNPQSPGYLCTPGATVDLTEKGTLLKTCFDDNTQFLPGGRGGTILEYDWEGNLLWSYRYSDGTKRTHHDIQRLPNGNLLITAWELKSLAEAQAKGFTGVTPPNNNPAGYWAETIIEVKPNYRSGGSEIVWRWSIWEHLCSGSDCTPNKWNINANLGGVPIVPNFNSIDYDQQRNQIFISCNSCSEIFVIEHGTSTKVAASSSGGRYGMGGDFLYRWGNPQNYGAPGVQQSFFQHTVRLIAPQDEFGWTSFARSGRVGNVIFFNNNVPGGSTVTEIVPPSRGTGRYVQPPSGGAFGPSEPISTIRQINDNGTVVGLISSAFLSNAQPLPNGHTLILSGATGTAYEVKPLDVNGVAEVVWKYVLPVENTAPSSPGSNTTPDTILEPNQSPALCPAGNFTATCNFAFRMTRYSPKFNGFRGKKLSPQPFQPSVVVTPAVTPSLFEVEGNIIDIPHQD